MKSGTQTDFVYSNIYIKNDVFDGFYKHLEYKSYFCGSLNTLFPKNDILHRIEKEYTSRRNLVKTIKSLENQVEDLKKKNQVLKEIKTSKLIKCK